MMRLRRFCFWRALLTFRVATLDNDAVISKPYRDMDRLKMESGPITADNIMPSKN
jgi:hypothetical protein